MAAKKNKPASLAQPVEVVVSRILLLRDQKTLLDADLAALYGVETRVLVQAVKRNLERFPEDFMFQLTTQEFNHLISQSVISSYGTQPAHAWGGRRTPPYAFIEQGVAMLSSVLNSSRAISVNIEIMRAFVKLREMLASNKDLAAKLNAMEHKLETHDQAIAGVLNAIREMMRPPEIKKRPIGFVMPQEKK